MGLLELEQFIDLINAIGLAQTRREDRRGSSHAAALRYPQQELRGHQAEGSVRMR